MIKKILQMLELIEHNQRKIITQNDDIYHQLQYMYIEWYEGRTKEKEEEYWKEKLK